MVDWGRKGWTFGGGRGKLSRCVCMYVLRRACVGEGKGGRRKEGDGDAKHR